jgi:hypothetical protein
MIVILHLVQSAEFGKPYRGKLHDGTAGWHRAFNLLDEPAISLKCEVVLRVVGDNACRNLIKQGQYGEKAKRNMSNSGSACLKYPVEKDADCKQAHK